MTMRVGGLLLRAVLLLSIFVAVGFVSAHLLIAHAVAHGTPEYQVRLAGYMGGLFAGGVAATVLGLLLLLRRGERPPR